MTVPAARRDQRLRRYPLRRLRLPMAGGNLSIVVPQEAEAVQAGALPYPHRDGRGIEPPYWASVWPAAVTIARWLCRRGGVDGRTVLDLGCGLGVPGVAAARCGGRVTFADVHPDALAFAAFNASQQGAAAERITTARIDWRSATVPGTFDLVLLADVSYRPVHHPPLLRHLRQCLRPGGLCVHADPLRRESDGFLVRLRREFSVRETTVDTHHDGARRAVRMTFVAHTAAALVDWLGAAPGLDTDDRDATGTATVAR